MIDDVPVRGTPEWLEGLLLRNGPGTFQVGGATVPALVRRARHAAPVLHRGRPGLLRQPLPGDEGLVRRPGRGRIAYPEFATDPCRSPFARAMAVFDPQVTDSAKVNIARVAEHFLPCRDPDPGGVRSADPGDRGRDPGWDTSTFGRMTTVHPHLDAERNEAINPVTRHGAASQYAFRRVDTSTTDLAATTPPPGACASRATSTPSGCRSATWCSWSSRSWSTRWTCCCGASPTSRTSGGGPSGAPASTPSTCATGAHVRTVRGPTFFAFHHVNAFDHLTPDGRVDEVVVDLVAYDDAAVIEAAFTSTASRSRTPASRRARCAATGCPRRPGAGRRGGGAVRTGSGRRPWTTPA